MLSPDNVLFYVMLLLVYLAGVLASAGGIGGGGVLVPIFLVLGGFSYYQATVCSACTLLGNCFAQFYINYPKAHPKIKQRPLIYWHAVLALLPCQLGGSNLGVFLVRLLPETPLLFLALTVLTTVIVKTSYKGKHLYEEEMKAQQEPQNTNLDAAVKQIEKCSSSEGDNNDSKTVIRAVSITDYEDSIIQQMDNTTNGIEKSRIVQPYNIFAILFGVFLYYLTIFLIIEFAIEKCSAEYYTMTFIIYIPLAIFVVFAMDYLRKSQLPSNEISQQRDTNVSNVVTDQQMNTKLIEEKNVWERIEDDIDFSKVSYTIPLIAFIVGCLCSLLGIGGGELMGPLLLFLHIIPSVSTATVSTLSFITAANNVAHHLVIGAFDSATMAVLAVVLLFIGAAAGTTGRRLALYYSEKYHRNSIFVFMIVIVLIISVMLLIYDIIVNEIDVSFHALC